MSTRLRIVFFILLLVIVGGVAGCGRPQVKVGPVTGRENPIEAISNLEKDLSVASENQLHVLAPGWFAKAAQALNDAKRGLEKGDSVTDLLQKAAYGRANLQRAEEAAEVARAALSDTIKARELALAAGAAEFGKDFRKVEEDFLELTEAIENDNLNKARKEKTRVTRAFDELELRAIKTKTLGEVRRLLEEAEKAGAAKLTPQTYAKAKGQLQAVDAFITEQRYQREMMQRKAEQAMFEVRRLMEVMRQSEQVKSLPAEDVVLWTEGLLHQTAEKVGAPDMRDQPFLVQVQAVLDSISALQAENNLLSDKILSLQMEIEEKLAQIATLEGLTRKEQEAKELLALEEQAAKARLDEERRFQQQFTEVQKYFSQDEAEVYKQGNDLVIRLKAMRFPVGKDFILPDNYPLLSKVQRAIRTFDRPSVLIEGHTDSTGSQSVNEELSKARAEAVRSYLVANGTLPQKEIVARGYGSRRPLAPNETPEGRAINRRIDVIIKPKPQTGS